MQTMAPTRLVGKTDLSCSRWHRIRSCMVFSTIILPTFSFRSSSSLLPSLQRARRVSGRCSTIGTNTWENKNDVIARRGLDVSLSDRWIMQQPQQRLALQSYTRLWMSTSIPSGLNVSEPSTWEKEDDEEESYEDDDQYTDSIGSEILLEEHQIWSTAVGKAVKSLGKKRKSLQSELKKAEGAESTAAYAQLLVSNLYMFQNGVKTATVNDWENDGKEVELSLDSTGKYNSASAEADALFSLVRKLKRGSKIVADLLEETAAAWDILSEAELDLKSARGGEGDIDIDEGRLAIVKERLIRTSRRTKFQVPTENDSSSSSANGSKKDGQISKNRRERKPELGTPASNVRKLLSPGGCIVLIGRNRRGNEHLSMSVARGNDIWMHSRGCPGAHVIIQNRRGGPTVTDECLQFGADLAIFYSDLRNENKAEVTAAEPKHVQKPRGAPLGAVKLREEWKTFVGRPDRVPNELKEAREKSGQTDEYHMLDKAKHRRRTKQVAEEDRAKKKQQQRERKNER